MPASHIEVEQDALWISNDRLSARILPFGASLADLRLLECNRPLVLGYADARAYPDHDMFFGAVIGPYANRISGGELTIDGQRVVLETNDGAHHLHGGSAGFGQRVWSVERAGPSWIKLSIESRAGDSGYPGSLQASVTYSLDGSILRLDLEAQADRAMPVNLCHHPYFNLAGRGDAGDHQLEIHASHYLPARQDLIPTGEIAPVAGTQYDFTVSRALRDAWCDGIHYNNTYCRPAGTDHWHAASLKSDGLRLDLHTNQPGLHFYDGYKINGNTPGISGEVYGPCSGLCLEAQDWPDSPRRSSFPQVILRPGQTFHRFIEYRISSE